jgi:hypothetical protein
MWLNTYSEIRRLRKRVVALETQFERERERHLTREDALVNLVTTAHGHRGISEPSVEPKKVAKLPDAPRQLTVEEEHAQAYFQRLAEQHGYPASQAEEWFAAHLRGEEPVMRMEN